MFTYQYNPTSYYAFFFQKLITIPFAWYNVEVGSNVSIYFSINGAAFSFAKCALPEGNYTTTTLFAAMCDVMNARYPFDTPAGAFPKKGSNHIQNLVNNIAYI